MSAKKSDAKGGKPVGAVLVVGGGITGMQASLDLADSGFRVHLLDASPCIGGTMAQLDKTFPTNDCAMCIMAPKLVESGRHLNIHLITNAELKDLRGEPGNFEAAVVRHPRYIDMEKCTGCGECGLHCPVNAISRFNEGLSQRRAVYIDYPQAVPLVYVIDRDKCVGCGLCEGACLADAVVYDDEEKQETLNVGAVVLTPGFEEFPAALKSEFGYGIYDNVVTSIEFERILSASGPYKGHVQRPSEGDFPQRIAFVQCVGSRDIQVGKEYCSGVCCMYATKEALIAKEHAGADLETTIFFMDMRAHGKGFDAYYERAANEHAVRYIRSRVSCVEQIPETKNLLISYETEDGEMVREEFDLVVLSVGLSSTESIRALADNLGVDLNEHGFCQTDILQPMRTSRPGVFVAGVFQSPKDIPESVTQASGAAAEASSLLHEVRGTLWEEKEYPPEQDVEEQAPRIGAFICHCGINIGGVVRVPEVVEYAKTLPGVVYVEHNLYTCSQDTQDKICETIKEHGLNRVVVASCTPRTHEPLFQETLRNAGLNAYLFEMTNIREHDSWAHQHDPDAATGKAKDLVRMAVAKAGMLESLQPLTVPLTQKALVVGGGVAGMTAALDIAEQGFDVWLVEKEHELGGNLRNLHHTSEVGDLQAFLKGLRARVEAESRIEVLLRTRVESVAGYVGSFRSTLATEGDDETATREIEHGVAVVATGAEPYVPTEYLYGKDPRVITQTELESKIVQGQLDWSGIRNVVMIQCVGSRDDERPYCSKICCGQAVKNANTILGQRPDAQVFVLYRDVRTYGFKEHYYNVAKESGAVFVRYEKDDAPQVALDNGDLAVQVDDPILGERLRIPADLLVLSTGVVAPQSNEALAKQLKVPLNEERFFLEAHVKLRPVDFATEGVFLAGLAHSPRSLDESIAQAHAAASHALILLAKGEVTVEPIVACVDEEECIGCGLCVALCPYNAMELELKEGGRKAQNIPASCKGCGTCAASCLQQAITMKHFTDRALIAQVEAAVV